MRRSTIVLLVLLAASLALTLPACGADGESRAPTATVHDDPVQTDEVEGEVDKETGDGGEGDTEKGKEKGKGKDRGKSRGNGQGGDD
jgi:hypothetical protein